MGGSRCVPVGGRESGVWTECAGRGGRRRAGRGLRLPARYSAGAPMPAGRLAPSLLTIKPMNIEQAPGGGGGGAGVGGAPSCQWRGWSPPPARGAGTPRQRRRAAIASPSRPLARSDRGQQVAIGAAAALPPPPAARLRPPAGREEPAGRRLSRRAVSGSGETLLAGEIAAPEAETRAGRRPSVARAAWGQQTGAGAAVDGRGCRWSSRPWRDG